jgi:hypothetical protein
MVASILTQRFAVLCAACFVMSIPAAAQRGGGQRPAPVVTPSGKPVPHTADGKPDFTGFFNLQYTPNMSFGKEDAVPYTDAGRAAYLNHDAKDDPTSNCWFPGVPRIIQ